MSSESTKKVSAHGNTSNHHTRTSSTGQVKRIPLEEISGNSPPPQNVKKTNVAFVPTKNQPSTEIKPRDLKKGISTENPYVEISMRVKRVSLNDSSEQDRLMKKLKRLGHKAAKVNALRMSHMAN